MPFSPSTTRAGRSSTIATDFWSRRKVGKAPCPSGPDLVSYLGQSGHRSARCPQTGLKRTQSGLANFGSY